jgi:hypothetical protein
MVWVWSAVGIAVAAVLGLAAFFDRRARRRGHRFRSGGEMSASVRQNRREVRFKEAKLRQGGGLASFLESRRHRGYPGDGPRS